MSDLAFVAFDIETTGFTVDDEVTTVGFALDMGVRVFVQTGGREAGDLEGMVDDRVEEVVKLSVHDGEAAMFEAVRSFVAERLQDDDVLLVAYNGERWKGGFDLPFLRTRLSRANVSWPFEDLPYADLMPVMNRRFNTSLDADETVTDLERVYDTLIDGGYGDLDPFEDSEEAVTAFENGRFTDLILHNVSDVLRTRALGLLAQRYCSKSDFQLKSLTATIDA